MDCYYHILTITTMRLMIYLLIESYDCILTTKKKDQHLKERLKLCENKSCASPIYLIHQLDR